MEIIPNNIVAAILDLPTQTLIGISGFGGAGKSTAANALGERIDAPVISVDSFFKSSTMDRYHRWEIIDFARLQKEVILPFKTGHDPIQYGHFDWGKNRVVETRTQEQSGRLIVEGVGLFRPELVHLFNYKIWIQCSPAQATERGKRRDREEYKNPQDVYWDGIWEQNDKEYLKDFNPIKTADVIVDNS